MEKKQQFSRMGRRRKERRKKTRKKERNRIIRKWNEEK
jgi:hypothetical protein